MYCKLYPRMKNFDAKEKAEFNQYWYSAKTVETIVQELIRLDNRRVAFLSTPSVFHVAVQAGVHGDLFDIDSKLFNSENELDDARCFKFDFQQREIATDLQGQYDCVVIDPPFISEEVLAAYGDVTKLLLCEKGKILISSIAENSAVLIDTLDRDIRQVPFKPSIPSLVYQYSLFVNYEVNEASHFARINSEVDDTATRFIS